MEHEHSILYEPFNKYVWRHAFGFDVPDHVIMALLVLLISSIIFPLMSRRISKDNPGNFQQFCELIVGGLRALLKDIVGGHHWDRFLYIIGAFATFIFISNIMGLFFFLQPPTGNVNTTFALSTIAFLYYNYIGIRQQGVGHYFAHFAGPVPLLAPLMFPIELIGHFARILSLGMRLFGNIFGEHTATGIFMGILPFIVPWPMMGLGIFGAFLQTFVFIMLTMVYIGGAVTTEDH
jgi:F-type H+-transporting ATPase subunit a